MRLTRLLLLFSAAACFPAVATDLTGTWKAVFDEPEERMPKGPPGITFDLRVDGTRLAGVARFTGPQESAAICDGKVAGDRVQFTVSGVMRWASGDAGVITRTGYSKLVFRGKLRGGTLRLKLDWRAVLDSGEEIPGHQHVLRARRI